MAYLSSFILLFGAEFNSEIEHQTARDTTRPPRLRSRSASAAPGRPIMWQMGRVTRAAKRERIRSKPLIRRSRARADAAHGSHRDPRRQEHEHPYIAARATNRAASLPACKRSAWSRPGYPRSACRCCESAGGRRRCGAARNGGRLVAVEAKGLSCIDQHGRTKSGN